MKLMTKLTRRWFSFRIEDVPSTLRHYVPGVAIDLNKLQVSQIEGALMEMDGWLKTLKAMKVENQRRLGMMLSGMALQGTMQALIMLDGLVEKATVVESSLQVLRRYKTMARGTDVTLLATTSTDLPLALRRLQPYYDGNRFIFDFDPPFYLLSQN